ncbi:MAG: hypothetical protein KF817_02610 [Phycisphaeraceae bacterium]|nr:hypothetical protein [Phycisphaeraceae bacterium]
MIHALLGYTCTALLVLAFVERLLRMRSSGRITPVGRPAVTASAARAGAALLPSAASAALLVTATGVVALLRAADGDGAEHRPLGHAVIGMTAALVVVGAAILRPVARRCVMRDAGGRPPEAPAGLETAELVAIGLACILMVGAIVTGRA